MFKVKCYLTTLIFLGLLLSCQSDEKISTKTIAVLYDLSMSVEKASLDNYADISQKAFQQLGDGDVMVGYKISQKSLMEQNHIFEVILPILGETSTNQIIKTKQTNDHIAAQKQILEEEFNKLKQELYADHSDVKQTDILASIQRAAGLFRKYPADKKYLFICSDMLQAEKAVNFENSNPDNVFTQKLIEQNRKDNLLPDLSGVVVLVEGANAPNNEKFNKVKQFWLTYLEACGATLSDENYAAHHTTLQKL